MDWMKAEALEWLDNRIKSLESLSIESKQLDICKHVREILPKLDVGVKVKAKYNEPGKPKFDENLNRVWDTVEGKICKINGSWLDYGRRTEDAVVAVKMRADWYPVYVRNIEEVK